jgi:hypothetical protein
MASIIVAGDTSGTITIEAPAVAGTNTITLPASTGTLATTATAGKILQVVGVTYAISVSTASATMVTTGLTASITPSSTSSKILVIANVNGARTAATFTGIRVNLYKDASAILTPQYYASYSTTSEDTQSNVPVCYLDSPATTSSITYTMYFNRNVGSGTVSVQANNSASTITLMEVAA